MLRRFSHHRAAGVGVVEAVVVVAVMWVGVNGVCLLRRYSEEEEDSTWAHQGEKGRRGGRWKGRWCCPRHFVGWVRSVIRW